MVLDWFIQNWPWTLFLALFGAGLVLMRKLPNTDIMGHVLFKINSRKGISLMDRLGRRYSAFWKNVGDLALILLFGGIGTAYVAYRREGKSRRVLLAALTFFAVFVYAGPNVLSFFPFALYLSPSIIALGLSFAASWGVYALSPRISRNKATLLAFGLAVLFFGSPYILSYFATDSLYYLAVGVSVGILGLPATVIVSLLIQAGGIAAGTTSEPGVNIGYPDIEDGRPVLKYAGTDISIPLFPDILLAIIILLVLHEGFHGLLSRAQGIRIKSTGLLFASIVPLGAFVEPDEKQFKKEDPLKRLRVYAVGSFANIFVVALVAFILGNLMVSTGSVQPEGFVINYVVVNSSADGVLEPGEVIRSVNGERTHTFQAFSKLMQGKSPGDELEIVTQNRTVSVSIGGAPSNSSQGFLGVGRNTDPILSIFTPSLASSSIDGSTGATLFNLLKWIFFLNLMLGLINLLPAKPLDGGYVYEGFFDWVEERLPFGRRLHLARIFSQGFLLLILAIFIINFTPYLF